MAGQITWRNVDQRPSTAEAALMFRSASTQMNQGIDTFGGLIKSAEAVDASNVKAVDEIGKQKYLDILQGAKTPEQLAALAADPATAAARDSLSAASRAATRGALDARTTSLRADETAALAFDNARKEVAEKPFKAELAALTLTNPEAAQARAQQYATEGKIRDASPFLKEAIATGRANTEHAHKEEAYTHALGNRPMADQALRDQAAAAKLTAESLQRNEVDRIGSQDSIAAITKNFADDQQAFNTTLRTLASENSYPVDKLSGLPDEKVMTPDQLLKLKDQMKAKGMDPDKTATSSQYLAKMQADLFKKNISPQAQAAALKTADSLLKSDTLLSSEDQGKKDANDAYWTAKKAEVQKDNLFYAPPKDEAAMRSSVMSAVETTLKDSGDTKTTVKVAFDKWMTDGLKFVDPATGKSTTVKIPPRVLDAAFKTGVDVDQWAILPNKSIEQTEAAVRRYMESPQALQQMADAEDFNGDGAEVKQKEFRRNLRRGSGSASPEDWSVSFNKAIANAQNKAKAPQTEVNKGNKATIQKNPDVQPPFTRPERLYGD